MKRLIFLLVFLALPGKTMAVATAQINVTVYLQVEPTLTVTSAHGTPGPAVGVHTLTTGSMVTATISGSPDVDTTGTTRWVSTGWIGSGNVPSSGAGTSTSFNLTQDSAITWTWKTQYRLAATANPGTGGSITLDGTSTPANANWFDGGTTATLRAVANAGWVFMGWGGDAAGMSTTTSLPMTRPRMLTANFKQKPAITNQPTSQTIDMGANVNFSTVAIGSAPLAYQWFKGGVPLNNGSGISGTTSATLHFAGVTEAAEGNYTCRVSNGAGNVLSHGAVLQVLRPGQLVAAPASLTFLEGSGNEVDVLHGDPPSTRNLTLTNTGEKTVSFTGGGTGSPGLALSGVRAMDYAIANVTPSTATPLAPGATVTVTLRFAPLVTLRTLGLEATLTVTTDSPVTPTQVIPLRGDAVPVGLSFFAVE